MQTGAAEKFSSSVERNRETIDVSIRSVTRETNFSRCNRIGTGNENSMTRNENSVTKMMSVFATVFENIRFNMQRYLKLRDN